MKQFMVVNIYKKVKYIMIGLIILELRNNCEIMRRQFTVNIQ